MFKAIEKARFGERFTTTDILAALRLNADGLIPAIAQQHDTGEVLMLAWMNAEALQETLRTGRVCYFSRSRQRLWRKGEESGQIQYLRSMAIDCDGDALLLRVDQTGPACHTGRSGCFYLRIDDAQAVVTTPPLIAPEVLYRKDSAASGDSTNG